MGIARSKVSQVSKEDLEFLLKNTHYDEKSIREWYRGFRQGTIGPGHTIPSYRNELQTKLGRNCSFATVIRKITFQ